MNSQWHNKFRNKMERHEESAPEGLWEAVEQRMSVGQSMKVVSSNNNRRRWAVSSVAIAAAILATLFVVRYNSSDTITGDDILKGDLADRTVSEQIISDQALSDQTSTDQGVSDQILRNQTIMDQPASDILIAESSSKATYIEKSALVRESASAVEQPASAIEQSVSAVDQYATSANNDILGNSETIVTDESPVSTETGTNQNDRLLAMSTTSTRSSRWQTSISMSNAPSGSTETYSGYGTFALAETVDDQYKFLSSYTDQDVNTDVKHDQPVTVGLTLRYVLSERWSIASGLNYSILSSQLHSAANNYYYDDFQKLHYLGIPLNLEYTYWRNNKISSYISAGGQMEKNIAGRLTSNYYLDNQLESTTYEKITGKHLQWSLNSAIGIEYQISDMFRLYAEPGVSYYFKNRGELETIYKDRPFSFNLRIGLRFTFND